MRKLCYTAFLLLCGTALFAQNASDLIIAEALVHNESSVVDGYGRRSGWLELFNTSQGTVNFAGCYLSDGTVRYMIPKGDRRTQLGPRQSVVFFCTGVSGEGTFHTNFTLREGTTLYLISNNGRTVIDSLRIPAVLPADMSVRKTARDNKGMDWKTDVSPAVPTPGAINANGNEKTGAERIAEQDPYGWILTLTSVSVVFGALIILWLIFGLSGRYFTRKAEAPKGGSAPDAETAAAIALALQMEGDEDVVAAIALALEQYQSETAHDSESFVLTQRTADSPWAAPARNFRKISRK